MAEKEALICKVEATMYESNTGLPSGLVGNARTLKPTTIISGLGRGINFSKKVQLSNPMDGIVIAYKPITEASPTSLIDRLRYAAAERPNFQMFNYVYKVWIPGLPGSTYNLFECLDWDDKEAFDYIAAQSPWVPIDISEGTNVQGAIPPATSVKVRFGRGIPWDPKIVEIGENIPNLVIPVMQKPPPGEAFKLGAPTGFGGGGAGSGGGGDAGAAATWASTSVSPFITDARCYDDAQDIPNKSQHASILADVHPDFLPHVKSFICEAWKQKQITIRLNSSYRSIERQQRLYDDWVAGGRTGIAPANPATGLSYHNLGMAIDFNPTLANGTRLMSTSSKSSWRSSGIVEIGKAAGMYWGGDFNSNFDPIHFDFRTRVSRGSRPAVLTAANSQGVSPNRANLDGIIT
jgi:hypothetical protein